jgi:hypothetical protein
MATYQITVNEHIPLGKSIVTLLKSATEAVQFNKTVAKENTSPLYYDLESAFKDVKLMVDGKKPKKPLDDLINELRNIND